MTPPKETGGNREHKPHPKPQRHQSTRPTGGWTNERIGSYQTTHSCSRLAVSKTVRQTSLGGEQASTSTEPWRRRQQRNVFRIDPPTRSGHIESGGSCWGWGRPKEGRLRWSGTPRQKYGLPNVDSRVAVVGTTGLGTNRTYAQSLYEDAMTPADDVYRLHRRGQCVLATMRCALVFVLVSSSSLAQDAGINERLVQLGARVVRDAALPGNPITEVDLGGSAASDDDMIPLSVLPHLRSIDISFTSITALGLKSLLRNPELRELAADGQGLRDQDLQLFSGTRIQLLHLTSNPRITGQGFRDLSLKELVELALGGCSIEADSLRCLPATCPNLRRLQIEYTDIPSPALRDVARLPCLEELRIPGSSIDDSHLAELAGAKGLKVLIVYDTDVTDRGLRSIAGATELRKLWVDETGVAGEAVSSFPCLESLSIGGPNVTLVFDRIASATHLRDLEITYSRITVESLRPFRQHSTLESLELTSCDIAHGALDELGVQKLSLWHCHLRRTRFRTCPSFGI